MLKRKYGKITILIWVAFLFSCASIPEKKPGSLTSIRSFKVGEYTVNITDFKTVNEEWKKLQNIKKLKKIPTVKGFTNYTKKEIWSIDNHSTIIHEFKHMVEGKFHKPFKKTDLSTLTSQKKKLYSNITRLTPCLKCHGEKGDGKVFLSSPLKTPPRNFTDQEYMKNISDERITHMIKEGSPECGMPAYKNILTEEELRGLVRFIRTLGGSAA